MEFWILMFKTLGGLCLVLGLLMAVLFALKHMTRPKGGQARGMIRLVSSFYLSPKERLHLMDVMGRKILIGVTSQGISRIAEFDGPDEPVTEGAEEAPAMFVDSLFKDVFSKISAKIGRETLPAAAGD